LFGRVASAAAGGFRHIVGDPFVSLVADADRPLDLGVATDLRLPVGAQIPVGVQILTNLPVEGVLTGGLSFAVRRLPHEWSAGFAFRGPDGVRE